MAGGATATSGLLERDDELEGIEAALAEARSGRGRLLFLEGEPGIGKTALLAELEKGARAGGFTVLAAGGGELERDFAYGVVRQLYEPFVRALPPARRRTLLRGAAALAGPVVGVDDAMPPSGGPQPADASFAANHGLYWLTVELSDEQPLLLLIDDAHWADSATLLFLNYLGRRLEELPVLAVLGLRPAEPGAPRELIDALRPLPGVERVEPAPLSVIGTAELIGRSLGRPPEGRFLASCHEATGGNPFLLWELLRALAAEGVEPSDGAAEHVARLGPRSISRSVLGRLATMWPEAVALARAVAVLGSEGELQHAARLAGLAPGAAEAAADALVDACVLAPARPLTFAHPIIRRAIYEDLPEGRRFNAHAQAARLLDAAGETDRAAIQLLVSDPAADEWVVERLRAASARALARGAPKEAAALLRRALEEPPEPGERVRVLHELGQAELHAGDPVAVEHLQSALGMADEPRMRAEIAATLAQAAAPGERVVEATRLLEAVLDDLPSSDAPLAHLLEGHLVALSVLHPDLIASAWARLDRFDANALGDSPGDRVLLAWLAARSMLRGDSSSEALTLARRALGGGRLLVEQLAHSQHYSIAASVPAFCDSLAESYANSMEAIEDSRRRGSQTGFVVASCFRSWHSLRLGELAAAEADARAAADLAEQSPLMAAILRYALYPLIEALVLRGQLEGAERELGRAPAELEQVELQEAGLVLHSRGLLRLAQRQPAAAVADLLTSGQRMLESGFANPSWLPWRSNAALAHHALDERDHALTLAGQELELARHFGAPRAVGVATRALGLVTGGETGLALLHEAVSVLEPTQARLEHAEALVALGSALRRANSRSEAREPLRQGMGLAHRRGAVPLAERDREELHATGARPRRLVQTGAASLTASERRVAQMAAEGSSNPQIAQALFVTRKTVETHLGHVFRKLDIRSREELSTALAEEERSATVR